MPDPIIVPDDVDGSWRAMLDIYRRLEEQNDLYEWSDEADFQLSKARNSKEIAVLFRHLANGLIRQKARIGGSLFGVVLKNPGGPDTHFVSLNMHANRKYRLRLIASFTNHARVI